MPYDGRVRDDQLDPLDLLTDLQGSSAKIEAVFLGRGQNWV